MKKILNSKYFYHYATAYLTALNLAQMYRLEKVLSAGKEIVEQRDTLLDLAHELIDVRDTLIRILKENNVEIDEFDQVVLESNIARLKALRDEYKGL